MTAALGGGPPNFVTGMRNPRGLWWGTDDAILAGQDGGIFRIPAAGGALELVVPLGDAALGGADPQLLPDGRHVLFTLADVGQASIVDGGLVFAAQLTSNIAVASLDTGEYATVIENGTGGRYLPTGHLVYVSEGTIFAAPFDLEQREVTGEPIAVLEGLSQTVNFGTPQLAVADNGTLMYVPGTAFSETELVWVDRAGNPSPPIPAEPDTYSHIRLSPDGRRIVSDAPGGVWILDVERGARLLLTQLGDHPIWTPDGSDVTFSTTVSLYVQPADGSGSAEELVTGEASHRPISWTPDGQTLLFESTSQETGRTEIWTVARGGDATPFLRGEQAFGGPQVSPDGRWVAYVSSESGRNEVYVQPFPGPGGRVVISTDGGRAPVWTRGGREIVYRNDDAVLAVDIETEPEFRPGVPRQLFQGAYLRDGGAHQRYDVSADGERFLMARPAGDDQSSEIRVVQNWTQELLERVPVP